ncbi:unnamed protein product [Prorocentrum cordatum]|uniref:Uncharacterized protein n=1 Tax=Prorocentrum cordatum TaxID=2364126 RepID=A0ABN9WLW0_9DINO|nr:unnamed protein product [Polarella glacialis]
MSRSSWHRTLAARTRRRIMFILKLLLRWSRRRWLRSDLCVLFVGEEEKEECHRVRADQGDASAVGSSCAVGSSTVRSAVGSSTVRSSADAVVDAVGISTAGSSAVGSAAVWSSADAVASNPGCKDEEEENVHSEAVAKMEQEEVAEEDFVHVGEGEKEECHRVRVDRGDASLRMKRYCFKRTETIESTKLHTSELHATNGSAVESTAVLSTFGVPLMQLRMQLGVQQLGVLQLGVQLMQ